MSRGITILGATGSVGQSTLDLIGRAPEDWRVHAVTANSDAAGLAAIARACNAELAVVGDDGAYQDLKAALSGSGIAVASGKAALVEAAERPADIVMSAIVGAAGLAPTLAAVRRGAVIALANKESLVCAGDIVTAAARQSGARLLPVDSEHNAIYQIFDHDHPERVARVILTASGGPFRKASVEAMRAALNELAMDGTVVIGEGERDEAPMLFIGEKVGRAQGTGPKIDIALDPLEGTTLTAKAGPNALAVLAVAEEGGLLNAPDVYMDKIAVGPGYPLGVIDLAKSVTENITAVAYAKGVAPRDITACVLDRPRHEALIKELRAIGCSIVLIPDGDVAGVIATTNPDTSIDIYLGSGGAPEGVLAAAALRCVGGQFQGRLMFRNDDERGRARRWGIEDLDRIYSLEDLAKGDVIFAATGVTDGSLLKGVKHRRDGVTTTQTVVMRASSGTVRWVSGEHRLGNRA